MFNLVDIARSMLTPDMIARLAQTTGLSPALATDLMPLLTQVLGTGFGHVASQPGGAAALVDMLASGKADASLITRLPELLSDPTTASRLMDDGGSILNMLFGSQSLAVTDTMARHVGADPMATGRLASLAAPLMAAAVGRSAGETGLTGTAAINKLFGTGGADYLAMLPAGLRAALAAIPGLGIFLARPAAAAPVSTLRPPEPVMPAPVIEREREREGGGIGALLPWLALLAGLVALVWYLTRDRGETKVAEAPAVTAPAVAASEEGTITATIPEGVTALQADPTMTTEACMTAFREALGRGKVEFDTASATVRPEATPVLDELAAVAGRCSGFAITVEGHTDLEGSQATNLPLSRDRAVTVANYLVGKGVQPGQLRAIGFGESRPVEAVQGADQTNRRIEFVVSQ